MQCRIKIKKQTDRDELIHIGCYIQEEPIEAKDDSVILFAEAWREKDVKQAHPVRISMSMDLYLDCLAECRDFEDVSLFFETVDSWKALTKVFRLPQFALLLDGGFDLMVEREDDMEIIKSF